MDYYGDLNGQKGKWVEVVIHWVACDWMNRSHAAKGDDRTVKKKKKKNSE